MENDRCANSLIASQRCLCSSRIVCNESLFSLTDLEIASRVALICCELIELEDPDAWPSEALLEDPDTWPSEALLEDCDASRPIAALLEDCNASRLIAMTQHCTLQLQSKTTAQCVAKRA